MTQPTILLALLALAIMTTAAMARHNFSPLAKSIRGGPRGKGGSIFKRLIVAAALAGTVESGAYAQLSKLYYSKGAPLSCVLLHPDSTSPEAIVIRGSSLVMYTVYAGEVSGTVEVLPPLNGFRTLIVKYDGGGADTMTVNVATGAARLAISRSDVFTFEGSCN